MAGKGNVERTQGADDFLRNEIAPPPGKKPSGKMGQSKDNFLGNDISKPGGKGPSKDEKKDSK